jgi:hypothetical protein
MGRRGQADFDDVTALFADAIDHGRRSERRAALVRRQKTYDANGFEGGSPTSRGAWEVSADVIKG